MSPQKLNPEKTETTAVIGSKTTILEVKITFNSYEKAIVKCWIKIKAGLNFISWFSLTWRTLKTQEDLFKWYFLFMSKCLRSAWSKIKAIWNTVIQFFTATYEWVYNSRPLENPSISTFRVAAALALIQETLNSAT